MDTMYVDQQLSGLGLATVVLHKLGLAPDGRPTTYRGQHRWAGEVHVATLPLNGRRGAHRCPHVEPRCLQCALSALVTSGRRVMRFVPEDERVSMRITKTSLFDPTRSA